MDSKWLAFQRRRARHRGAGPLYQPNAWGLHDIHGNAVEWTHSEFAPGQERKVVPGGSWRDMPACSTAGFRLGYAPWQRVYNVGFRVVLEPAAEVASQTP